MRLRSRRHGFSHQPFAGAGTSLYVAAGGTVRYRDLRALPRGRCHRGVTARRRGWLKGTTGNHDIAAAGVPKTARAASAADPDAEIEYALPPELWPSAGNTARITVDVRTWKDHVENENENFRTVTLVIDGNGDEAGEILGTATLLNTEVLAGGTVRLRFVYHESADGVQPARFRALAAAGPTAPAEVTLDWAGGTRVIEIDTPALDDSAPYTYTLRAENAAGTVTQDVLTGLPVQADATGPEAPGTVTVEVV